MPLDVTVGGAAADSYASIAEADEFAASDLGRFATAWSEAPTEKKEAALRRATREIDFYVGVLPEEAYFYGVQALAFPRARDVTLVGAPFIPLRVKRAAYLQAAYLCAVADQVDEGAARRAKGFTNYANPDGTGGSLAREASFGRYHPDFEVVLGTFESPSVIGTIVKR